MTNNNYLMNILVCNIRLALFDAFCLIVIHAHSMKYFKFNSNFLFRISCFVELKYLTFICKTIPFMLLYVQDNISKMCCAFFPPQLASWPMKLKDSQGIIYRFIDFLVRQHC